MSSITDCVYPRCATWEVAGVADDDPVAGLHLCRGDDVPVGLCDGDDPLHFHLLFVGGDETPWPGKGGGDFYVEDNSCDSEAREVCYLRNELCAHDQIDDEAHSLAWHTIETLWGTAPAQCLEPGK